MVDGDIAALTEVFESDGATDASGTAGYGGDFGEEEVVGHCVYFEDIVVMLLS